MGSMSRTMPAPSAWELAFPNEKKYDGVGKVDSIGV